MKKFFILIACCIFLSPTLAFANRYQGSGSDDPNLNEMFCYAGYNHEGVPVYENPEQTRFIFDYPGNTFTVIDDHVWSTVENVFWYSNGSQNITGSGIWNYQEGPYTVPPTFSLIDYSNDSCLSSVASSTATSSIASATSTDIYYRDWLYIQSLQLIFLSFIGFGTIFSIFRKPTK